MQQLTVEGIKDYQVCNLFYRYRHVDNEHENITSQKLMAERFHNILTRVAAFFFYKKQSGMTPSYNALLNRWERLWFPKEVKAHDLLREQHNTVHGNLSSYSNIASVGLLKLYEDFSETQLTPMLIDERYVVPVGDEARLKGTIDLVLRSRDTHQIYLWSTAKRRPTATSLLMDLAALKVAYDYRVPQSKHLEYYVYDLASSNPGAFRIPDDLIDVDAFNFWVKTIESGVPPAPRRGMTAYCKGCPFDLPCSKFKYEELV